MSNIVKSLFIILSVMVMIAGCQSSPVTVSKAEEDALFDKKFLDEMRREVLGISEDEEIDYDLFSSIREIIIENDKGKTEYILDDWVTPATLSFHIKDISYLILFDEVHSIQIYFLPTNIIPDFSTLEKLNYILLYDCDVQSIDGLKYSYQLTHLSIFNSYSDAVRLKDLYKISNLRSLEEIFITHSLIVILLSLHQSAP